MTMRAAVRVIWVSPRFGHPQSQNPSDMGIPYNPIPNPKPYEKGMPISLEFYYNTAAISPSQSTTQLA